MREIDAQAITAEVARLCVEANYFLTEDVWEALRRSLEVEESPEGKDVLQQLLENARIAHDEQVPICQDCGTAIVFLELGQEAHIVGGDLNEAVQEGVRRSYQEGYLRKSIVDPPIFQRKNTRDNTPAVIHTEIVPGDRLKIMFMAKGGGSENVSALGMLTPAQGAKGVADFVVAAVEKGGSNPCPPVVVGVGVGGTADQACLLAKKALFRRLGEPNPDPQFAALEKDVLQRVNATGIGPAGFGGRVTALAVHIEALPCHIASLPMAVNVACHADRHKEAVL
ncbi:MAG: fumarate hydratase [Bacteroidetes bacterium]|nr:fumarate hydratase [Bacteroidota bacterium]